MPSWTCPSPKCTYDKRLEPGQNCPLCGEQAKGFNFTEFGNILKEKWSLKKTIMRHKEEEKALSSMKFCPKCGSTNINPLVFYRPSIWKCLNCGYEGALILQDGNLAGEIQKRYQSNKRKRT